MVFAHTLSQYMSRFGCSVTRLCEISGISKSTISRYRTGLRLPEAVHIVTALANALMESAGGSSPIPFQELLNDLNAAYEADMFDFDYEKFSKRLDKLIRSLKINITNMALCCSMDVSNLSRVRSGLRKPRDPHGLIRFIAEYVTTHYKAPTDRRKAAELIGSESSFTDTEEYRRCLCQWLSGEGADDKPLPVFELSEHMELCLEDTEPKRRASPLRAAVKRVYTGAAAESEAMLDLVYASLFSKSPKDMIIYSDGAFRAPDDALISLLFELIRTGRHINVILGLSADAGGIKELFASLLPLVLSGGLSLHCLEGLGEAIFTHLIAVSGTAALYGDNMAYLDDAGEYELTREASSVALYRARAERLLARSRPVMARVDMSKGMNGGNEGNEGNEGSEGNELSGINETSEISEISEINKVRSKNEAIGKALTLTLTHTHTITLSLPRIRNIEAMTGERGIVFTDVCGGASAYELIHPRFISALSEWMIEE